MAEVAKVAGVSHQTVSRVINGFPGVRPDTRERIEAAIKETGYRRNSAARTLVTRRSGLIGVIAVGSFLYGPTSTLAAIDEAARKHDYTIMLSNIREGSETEFRNAVESCLDRAVEAVLIIATREVLVEYLHAMQIDVPTIVVGPSQDSVPGGLNTMCVDQEQGAHMAVQHLIDLGHRDITLVTGPHNWIEVQERCEGAKRTCAEAGIKPTIYEGDWSAAFGYQLGKKLTDPEGSLPEAIFAANDHMALGLIAAFHENGIKLPEDVSIVGFDDVPEASFYTPSLTTIHQDFTTLGRRVLEAALALLDDERPDMTPVAATLNVRASTARA
ncbi:MAG: LacI family DNA-binding transcriptional regulator [Ancrocorticia populi]|uniref:LacI family DNA-binding transcriptional regulator n=1 Tax=Ancrocorticia populi TaxID=2175228 RepID=UPI003F8D9193